MTERNKPEVTGQKQWSPLDQQPFQEIISDEELIPRGLLNDQEKGPKLLLWELANLGKVKKLENPPEKVSEEAIQAGIQGWVGRKNDVMKLLKDPKMSDTYHLLQNLAHSLNDIPFGLGYLWQIKKSGYLSKGFELRKSTQESHVPKYQTLVKRFSGQKYEGLIEIVPALSTEADIGEIVPGKSITRQFFEKTRASLTHRENQDS